ncbi:hypothetical protein GIB67_030745, partial [Kingdonia uniflora]
MQQYSHKVDVKCNVGLHSFKVQVAQDDLINVRSLLAVNPSDGSSLVNEINAKVSLNEALWPEDIFFRDLIPEL